MSDEGITAEEKLKGVREQLHQEWIHFQIVGRELLPEEKLRATALNQAVRLIDEALKVLSCDVVDDNLMKEGEITMSADTTKQTEATLVHHLQAFAEGDINAILTDYVEESILYTPDGPMRGLSKIREFFSGILENMPPGFMEAFEMVRQDVEGEIAYIVWKSPSAAPLGTDTFVIRNGKIVVQTFAAHMT